jgi:hypothetical protein
VARAPEPSAKWRTVLDRQAAPVPDIRQSSPVSRATSRDIGRLADAGLHLGMQVEMHGERQVPGETQNTLGWAKCIDPVEAGRRSRRDAAGAYGSG